MNVDMVVPEWGASRGANVRDSFYSFIYRYTEFLSYLPERSRCLLITSDVERDSEMRAKTLRNPGRIASGARVPIT